MEKKNLIGAYEKPELVKHETLKEVTMSSRSRGGCSTCRGDEDDDDDD